MKDLLTVFVFGVLLAACAISISEERPKPVPTPIPNEAHEREFTERSRVNADLERDRMAATAQADYLIATATAQAAAHMHATAVAPTAEAIALQAQQAQAARTQAFVWGFVAVVGVVGACVGVYIWQMGRVRVEAIRHGMPPTQKLPTPTEWDVMQESARRRGQRIEQRGNVMLLIDNETNAVVKRREL